MDEAKKLGDVAYNDKNWVEAIKQYSASIDLKEATSSVKVLRSLYSNRSATYLEQKQFTAALLDADECIKLDSDWAKGHSRRGKALYSLRRWADSEASYTRAEALEPGKGYREKAQKASQAAAYQERAARQQQAGSSSGGVMGTSIPKAPTDGILKILYGAAEKGMFLLYFFFFPSPFRYLLGSYIPDGIVLWRAFLACALTLNILHIYCSCGMIRFNQDYLRDVLQYRGVHCLFLGLILFAIQPYLIAAAPLLLNQVAIRMPIIVDFARPQMAQIKTMAPASMAGQLDQMEALLNSPQGVQTLVSTVNNLGCTAEVGQGVYLIIELLFPRRNFVLIGLWWQYLMMRYLMDLTGGMKAAFTVVDSQMIRITSSNMCPGILGKGYGMVKGFMISQIDYAKAKAEGREPAGGGGGMMDGVKNMASKCSIS